MANGESKKLAVDVIARIDKLEKGMAKAAQATKSGSDKMDRSVQTARSRIEGNLDKLGAKANSVGASFLKGLVAPMLALGAAGSIRAIGDVANSVARIGDEAKRAGLGIQAFQELRFVAEQNRIGVDALTDGIKELNLRADEFIATGGGSAAEAFARLGYGAEELNAKLQDPSALFTEIIGKLGQLDTAAQIRVSDELFGGSGGAQFVQLIGQGEVGIRNTIQAAHDLGAVLSAETIAKADELDRKFQAVTVSVSSGLKQAIVEAAASLDDFLNSFGQTPSQAFADLAGRVSGIRAEMEAFYAATIRTAPESAAAVRLIIDEVNNGGLSADAASEKLRAMAAIDMSLFPITSGLSGVIALLEHVAGKAQAAGAAVAAATSSPVGSMPGFGDMATFGKPTTVPGSGKPAGGGGASAAASAAAAQTKAILDQIAALEYERTTIGMNAKELAVANALRSAGTTATEAQRQSIEALVAGNLDLQASQDQVNASLEQMQQIGSDVLGGIISDLQAGKSAADVFANALGSIGNALLQSGLTAPIGRVYTMEFAA